jgi:hypothetical protein
MGWCFGVDCVVCVVRLVISAPGILSAGDQQFAAPFLHRLLMYPIFPLEVAMVEGVAWWTIWRRKPWATGFGIAASLMFCLIFVRQFILPLPPVLDRHISALIFGIIGLAHFASRGKYPSSDFALFERLHERNAPGSLFGKR